MPVLRVIRQVGGERQIDPMRWGLIPFFARGAPPKYSTRIRSTGCGRQRCQLGSWKGRAQGVSVAPAGRGARTSRGGRGSMPGDEQGDPESVVVEDGDDLIATLVTLDGLEHRREPWH